MAPGADRKVVLCVCRAHWSGGCGWWGENEVKGLRGKVRELPFLLLCKRFLCAGCCVLYCVLDVNPLRTGRQHPLTDGHMAYGVFFNEVQ